MSYGITDLATGLLREHWKSASIHLCKIKLHFYISS